MKRRSTHDNPRHQRIVQLGLRRIFSTHLGPLIDLSSLNFDSAYWLNSDTALFGIRVKENRWYVATLDKQIQTVKDITPPNLPARYLIKHVFSSTNSVTLISRDKNFRDDHIYKCKINLSPVAQSDCAIEAKFRENTIDHYFNAHGDVIARNVWQGYENLDVEFQIKNPTGDKWRSLFQYDYNLTGPVRQVTYPKDSNTFIALSRHYQDTASLFEIDASLSTHKPALKREQDIIDVITDDHRENIVMVKLSPDRDLIEITNDRLATAMTNLEYHMNNALSWKFLAIDHAVQEYIIEVISVLGTRSVVLIRSDGKVYELEAREHIPDGEISFVEPVSVEIPGGHRDKIQAFLSLPREDGKRKKRADGLVIMIHGGPHAHYRWEIHPFVQELVLRGIGVLQLNYRGSTGYGNAYRNNSNEQGVLKAALDDVREAIRWLKEKNIVEKGKIGVWGSSFGSLIAVLAAKYQPEEISSLGVIGGFFDMEKTIMGLSGSSLSGSYHARILLQKVGMEKLPEWNSYPIDVHPCMLAKGIRQSTIIFISSRDRVTHPDQSIRFYDELQKRAEWEGNFGRLDLHIVNAAHGVRDYFLGWNIWMRAATFFHRELTEKQSHEEVNEASGTNKKDKKKEEGCWSQERGLKEFITEILRRRSGGG